MRARLQSQSQAEHLHKDLLSRYLNDCIVPSSSITALCAWLQPTQKACEASLAFQASLAACAAQVLTATWDTYHGHRAASAGRVRKEWVGR